MYAEKQDCESARMLKINRKQAITTLCARYENEAWGQRSVHTEPCFKVSLNITRTRHGVHAARQTRKLNPTSPQKGKWAHNGKKDSPGICSRVHKPHPRRVGVVLRVPGRVPLVRLPERLTDGYVVLRER